MRASNPVKPTWTSTTPQLTERTGVDVCLLYLHSRIDPSELAAKALLRVASEEAMLLFEV